VILEILHQAMSNKNLHQVMAKKGLHQVMAEMPHQAITAKMLHQGITAEMPHLVITAEMALHLIETLLLQTTRSMVDHMKEIDHQWTTTQEVHHQEAMMTFLLK
jgi:phosphomannomutase